MVVGNTSRGVRGPMANEKQNLVLILGIVAAVIICCIILACITSGKGSDDGEYHEDGDIIEEIVEETVVVENDGYDFEGGKSEKKVLLDYVKK